VAWFVAAIAVAALLVFYASWTARRLDRLHARVDAAAASLDSQLRERAAAALVLADSGELPRSAAEAVRAAGRDAHESTGLGHDREKCENALSRSLRDRLPDGADGPAAHALADEATRASFARRFHNDAVRDVEIVRRRRVVRWLHLAGHAAPPTYFEIDDGPVGSPSLSGAFAPYD
jgi:hypothetical protein